MRFVPKPKSAAAVAAIAAVVFSLAASHLVAFPAREQPDGGTVAVVATTSIVGDIVARIGGDRISLYVMLPPGADPHVFQPTPRDARQVADAVVVFANGAGLEADFLGDLIVSAQPRLVVELSEHLPLRRPDEARAAQAEEDDHAPSDHDEEEHDHHDLEFDPHVWMDPTLVAGWTSRVAEVLSELDPDYAPDYARRAAALAGELHELDAWIRTHVAAVPHDRRVLVTDHEVFGYFSDRYGFELLATVIPGASTASEPSIRHMAELREAIAERGIPAIFVGTSVSRQIAEPLTSELGIELVAVHTGSLSEPGGPADTYEKFIRTNVERIVTALAR